LVRQPLDAVFRSFAGSIVPIQRVRSPQWVAFHHLGCSACRLISASPWKLTAADARWRAGPRSNLLILHDGQIGHACHAQLARRADPSQASKFRFSEMTLDSGVSRRENADPYPEMLFDI
jgi:hypothetical protein